MNTIHILGEVSYNVIGICGIFFFVKLRFYLLGEVVLKVNGNLNNFVVGYLLEVAQELV